MTIQQTTAAHDPSTDAVSTAPVDLRVRIDLSLAQAQAVATAVDLFTRVSLGQFNELASRFAFGEFAVARDQKNEGRSPTVAECDEFRRLCEELRLVAGHATGSSFGLGSRAVSAKAHASYEVMKVLKQQLAQHLNPAPSFRGVDYDGLTVRYTQDAAPTCVIAEAA